MVHMDEVSTKAIMIFGFQYSAFISKTRRSANHKFYGLGMSEKDFLATKALINGLNDVYFERFFSIVTHRSELLQPNEFLNIFKFASSIGTKSRKYNKWFGELIQMLATFAKLHPGPEMDRIKQEVFIILNRMKTSQLIIKLANQTSESRPGHPRRLRGAAVRPSGLRAT